MNELNVDKSVVLVEDAGEVFEDILLDHVVHKVFVELLGVDGVLGNVAYDLHHHLLVALGNHIPGKRWRRRKSLL